MIAISAAWAIIAGGNIGTAHAQESEIDLLIDNLVEGDRTAGKQLVDAGAPAVEPLASLLDGRDHDVRIAAIDLLGKIGDPQAVEPLLDIFEDQDYRIRVAVAQALGRLGGSLAIESLINGFADSASAPVVGPVLVRKTQLRWPLSCDL